MSERASSRVRAAVVVVAMLGSAGIVLAAPPPVRGPVEPTVLIVGDSWAELMWLAGSLDDVFAAEGRPDVRAKGDVTAISGTTAADWTDPVQLQLVTDELVANPSIEVVQITLGGNDLLDGQSAGGWWHGMDPGDESALFDRVAADVGVVVDHVLAHDATLQVVVSLYDYPNFVESITGLDPFGCEDRWIDLGQPAPLDVNSALADVGARIVDAVAAPGVRVLVHDGLMQYVFGGGAPPPGDPSAPSPIGAMLLGLDCIHLSSDGYLAVAQNLWDRGYYFVFGGLFGDGFESGDVSGWTSSTSP